MKDVYTLKQILFALRKEYLEMEKKLEELKKHIILKNNAAIDLMLHGRHKELIIEFSLVKNLLDTMMLKFCGYSFNNKTYYLCSKKEYYDKNNQIRDKYYFKEKEAFGIIDIEQLKNELNLLFDSEFLQNIEGLSIYPNTKEKEGELFCSELGIGLFESKDYPGEPTMFYNPKGDKIIVKTEKRIITPDYIQELFGLNFNTNDTNADIAGYISKIIDNYEEKEICISEDFKSKKIKLQITEEPKKLILKPRRNI